MSYLLRHIFVSTELFSGVELGYVYMEQHEDKTCVDLTKVPLQSKQAILYS
jgi:hypothetical protein